MRPSWKGLAEESPFPPPPPPVSHSLAWPPQLFLVRESAGDSGEGKRESEVDCA